ncbi:MAG: ABC transporter substrate-binding protein [Oscillospiraceae bacterium]|nr:ABC transporter substrate-binding protein [Oscillospiraceae bacterium]
MKKIFCALCAAAMMAATLAGCGSAANSKTIKVGVNYELSGAVATYGQSSVDGVELAIEQINAAGGINGKTIEIVKYDNKSDAAEATTLGKKLMGQDKVVAMIGPATSGNFKAVIPDANSYKIPVISGSATADDVTVANGTVQEYTFRICFNDSFQGTTMATFAGEKLGATKAVILKDSTSDYALGLAKSFTSTFEAAGGEIVAEESYTTNDKDFSAILTNIKDKGAEVIFIPGYYQQVGLIIKQARELGIDLPVLGADGFDSPDLVALAGAENLNDVYYSNHYSSLDQDPKVQDFIADFSAKYGSDPDAFNALGYDAAMLVCDALARTENLTGESLKEAMASTVDFAGVTGTLSVDENHNAVKSIVVIGLENGEQASAEKIG